MLTNRLVNQSDMFHPFSGAELRDRGIKLAVEHANEVNDGWADRAYAVLQEYIRTHMGKFMCEHVREYAKATDLPQPPHLRSWGSIFQRAAREGIIVGAGYGKVKNAKAHCANASFWIKA